MISKDKQYRTRDGREVRIYAVDGVRPKPIHGAVKSDLDGSWHHYSWHENGMIQLNPLSVDMADLIEAKPRHEQVVWLNVYLHGGSIAYFSRNLADANRMNGCIACIKVDLDFEEGEGL